MAVYASTEPHMDSTSKGPVMSYDFERSTESAFRLLRDLYARHKNWALRWPLQLRRPARLR